MATAVEKFVIGGFFVLLAGELLSPAKPEPKEVCIIETNCVPGTYDRHTGKFYLPKGYAFVRPAPK